MHREASQALSPCEEKALAVILAGGTGREAAEAAGVTPSTISRWRHHHRGFRDALDQGVAELRDAAKVRVEATVDLAISRVRAHLEAGDPRVELRAAELALRSAKVMSDREGHGPYDDLSAEELDNRLMATIQRIAAEAGDGEVRGW